MMFAWIFENLATILLSLALVLLVCAIIWKLVRDRRKGKRSCGCGCQNCAMSGTCHMSQQKKSG